MNFFDFWGASYSTENLTEDDFERPSVKSEMADAYSEIERYDLRVSLVQERAGLIILTSEGDQPHIYQTRFCLECRRIGNHAAGCQTAEVEHVMET